MMEVAYGNIVLSVLVGFLLLIAVRQFARPKPHDGTEEDDKHHKADSTTSESAKTHKSHGHEEHDHHESAGKSFFLWSLGLLIFVVALIVFLTWFYRLLTPSSASGGGMDYTTAWAVGDAPEAGTGWYQLPRTPAGYTVEFCGGETPDAQCEAAPLNGVARHCTLYGAESSCTVAADRVSFQSETHRSVSVKWRFVRSSTVVR